MVVGETQHFRKPHLDGGFKYFLCSPLLEQTIQFDYSNIFQRGWFNHQLAKCFILGRLLGTS